MRQWSYPDPPPGDRILSKYEIYLALSEKTRADKLTAAEDTVRDRPLVSEPLPQDDEPVIVADYRSPFVVNPGLVNDLSSHGCWYYHREQYVKTGKTSSLDTMLGLVTMDNPPMAPDADHHGIWMETEPSTDVRRWDWFDRGFTAFAIIVSAVIAGSIGGWAGVEGTAAALFFIFMISSIASRLCTHQNEPSAG